MKSLSRVRLLPTPWTPWTPWTYSPPGSSVHGILQARVLEWGAITFSINSGKAYYIYLELVYLVTALVPSDMACLASFPESSKCTAVWITLDVIESEEHSNSCLLTPKILQQLLFNSFHLV